MPRQSFSGDHPYQPQCLAAALDPDAIRVHFDLTVGERVNQITRLINHGTCPRCLGPLPTSDTWLPAGSHATACRCIPVCGTCGTHESLTGLTHPRYWPVDHDVITAYVAQVLGQAEPAILDTDTGTLISEDGVIGKVNLPDQANP